MPNRIRSRPSGHGATLPVAIRLRHQQIFVRSARDRRSPEGLQNVLADNDSPGFLSGTPPTRVGDLLPLPRRSKNRGSVTVAPSHDKYLRRTSRHGVCQIATLHGSELASSLACYQRKCALARLRSGSCSLGSQLPILDKGSIERIFHSGERSRDIGQHPNDRISSEMIPDGNI